MKVFRFMPIWFLLVASPGSFADELEVVQIVDRWQDEWAEIFYRAPHAVQSERLHDLLARALDLGRRYPQRAEPLVFEAIVLCSLAGVDWGLNSLSWLNRARDLLIRAIDIDPMVMEGSAYIALGNLYYRLPGWPISYGDDDLARQYLETAVMLFPNGLDSNYFLGDFLLAEDDYEAALKYLERAERAPIRPSQRLSDSKLKEEVGKALRAARERHDSHADFFSQFTPEMPAE